jgi:hypothetical protein
MSASSGYQLHSIQNPSGSGDNFEEHQSLRPRLITQDILYQLQPRATTASIDEKTVKTVSDQKYWEYLTVVNDVDKMLSLASELSNLGNIYTEITDYPELVSNVISTLTHINKTIHESFKSLLYPAIIQHIKTTQHLTLIYINAEHQEIHYTYNVYYNDTKSQKQECWFIKITEYDPILNSATLAHKQYASPINPFDNPEATNIPAIIKEEFSTVSINTYKQWLQATL